MSTPLARPVESTRAQLQRLSATVDRAAGELGALPQSDAVHRARQILADGVVTLRVLPRSPYVRQDEVEED